MTTTTRRPPAELGDERTAQRRADRIRAFRDELEALEEEGLLRLDTASRQRVVDHHEDILARLGAAWDIDRSETERQMSWGMRIAALLGAAAICASAWFAFLQVWGYLGAATQVAIPLAGALLALAGAAAVARRERGRYLTTILALLAAAALAIELAVLTQVFNIPPTDAAIAAIALFMIVLAYGYRLPLLGLLGATGAAVWVGSRLGGLMNGEPYPASFEAEALVLGGLAAALVPLVPARWRDHALDARWRIAGSVLALGALFALANHGASSELPLAPGTAEALYQVVGSVAAAGTIAAGLWRRWPELVYVGTTAFLLFIYTKFFDWWWDLLPRSVFFLIVGVTGLVALAALSLTRQRLRRRFS